MTLTPDVGGASTDIMTALYQRYPTVTNWRHAGRDRWLGEDSAADRALCAVVRDHTFWALWVSNEFRGSGEQRAWAHLEEVAARLAEPAASPRDWDNRRQLDVAHALGRIESHVDRAKAGDLAPTAALAEIEHTMRALYDRLGLQWHSQPYNSLRDK